MKEGMFYEKVEGEKVKCMLCPHQCLISPGKRGICGVRENRGGKLFSLVYGKAVSWAADPIEKKPFYHFYPGTTAFSFATVGCNLHCLNCQNYSIAHLPKNEINIPGHNLSPEEIVILAKREGSKSIAYTYTEPTIFYEYAYETCKIAHEEGIKNVFVTNGYILPEPLKKIAPFLDGANVDLKSIKDDFYKKVCHGRLAPVLEGIRLMKELNIWVEITTLVIPGMNDSDEEFSKIADFILKLGEEIPWHLSRFYPAYKLTQYPPTPKETLHRARKIGLEKGLKYVYTGNVPGDEGENTFCPKCGKIVIKRYGYLIEEINIKEGRCKWCNNKIDGVGLNEV